MRQRKTLKPIRRFIKTLVKEMQNPCGKASNAKFKKQLRSEYQQN